MTVSQAFQIALQHHQAGRLAEAEALCHQILQASPGHAGALQFLGFIAHQTGRHELAVERIRQAIALNPNDPLAHFNLGVVFRALGRLDEAVAAYWRVLELKPDQLEAQINLGNTLTDQRKFDEAISVFRRALELKPDLPVAHNNLGAALAERGETGEAIAAYRRALHLKPDYPEAHNNLGNALRALGQIDEAVAAYRCALELRPDYPEAHNNLGISLRERGQLDEAAESCRRALELKPDYPEAHNNLGNALKDLGELEKASVAYRRALELMPGDAMIPVNLGVALARQGQPDEAISAYRRSLQIKPENAEAWNNLGTALLSRGELLEAIAAYRHALQIEPGDASAHSNLIYALHLYPRQDDGAIFEEQRRWNRRFSDPLKRFIPPHGNDRSPERRLRVGYVSPDFRDHPVGRFALPLFERHDREQFEVLCYSGVLRADSITERFRALAAGWRNTIGVSDARLAEMIREDRVDILVDLALHTAGNRLPVLARQPAPVQAAWLGQPGGTGLDAIGYRLTDACVEPPEEDNAWSAERRVRLPGCWCCFQPEGEYPEINALPALAAEGVTFGALNNFAKMHDGVVALWARALNAVKGSRIVLRCPDGQTQERVRAAFGAWGIRPERVELAAYLSHWDYLRLYQRIDLGLDPFPYNGTSTTCDALWMGVPVLTLTGPTPSSRAGLSLLSSAGFGEWAAQSEEDFLRRTVELAGNLPLVADLRATLRSRMRASPLMDAPGFARNVERAYRKMWQAWSCRQSPRSQGPDRTA